MTRAKVYINDPLCGILTEDHEGYSHNKIPEASTHGAASGV